jgi:Tfp pilus assembly PilM family ATPase
MSVLASWLASPPPDAVIEIAPERVSGAVVASRGGQLVVGGHASEALTHGVVVPSLTSANVTDSNAVTAALRRVIERLGTRPRRVALVIPDTAVKVSLVRFERIPPRRDDLEQLVRWQVRKSAPFPVEQACVSYTANAAGPDGSREFVVVLAREDVVREYESVCGSVGLYAGLVDAATLSLLNLFFAGTPAPTGDWLLVHVRPEYTSIAIARDTDLIFYRNRAEGDEATLPDLVHQTAMYYEDRLSGRGFGHVLLAGSGGDPAAMEAARHSLQERLGIGVEAVDPTRTAALTDRIQASPDLMDALGPLVGMALRTRRETVRA